MQENCLMTIADFNIKEMTAETTSALELHTKIMSAEQSAANAMLSLCENLKTMRDQKLYNALGFDTFEEYSEKACGIKKRQAYNYIQTYERLGKSAMQSNAQLGITKLQLLSEVCAVDREEFVENNDLDGMSVAEIKKLVEDNRQRGEQLDLLENQVKDLEAENAELRNRPVEVAVAEPSKEDIDKAVELATAKLKKEHADKIKELKSAQKEAVKKAENKAKSVAESENIKAVEKAKEEEKARITALYQDRLDKANSRRQEALKKAEEMAARLTNSADTELVMANVYFTTAQQQLAQFKEQVQKIQSNDPDKANKLIALTDKLLAAYLSDLKATAN